MSDKASDHEVYEHEHVYRHLITSCTKKTTRDGPEWERRDDFFCEKCLNIITKVQRDITVWQPSWWITKGDER